MVVADALLVLQYQVAVVLLAEQVVAEAHVALRLLEQASVNRGVNRCA